MLARPEDLHPALVAAYNAGDAEAMFRLYDPNAVFVIKPGRVTRSGDVTLVLGTFQLSGRRRDSSSVELAGRFADVLRLQPDGGWLLAVDNGLAGE